MSIELAKAKEQAANDLADIHALSESKPFTRYWVRRLGELHNKEVRDSLHLKTVEDREKARVRAVLLTELADLPAQDRAQCEKFLSAPEPGQRVPTQAG